MSMFTLNENPTAYMHPKLKLLYQSQVTGLEVLVCNKEMDEFPA